MQRWSGWKSCSRHAPHALYARTCALPHGIGDATIRVVAQGIEKIEGLDGCPALRSLWLQRNRITSLAGLSRNTNLVELYVVRCTTRIACRPTPPAVSARRKH